MSAESSVRFSVRTLQDLGERRIVSELLAPRYAETTSFGDDCAAVADDLVMTTDSCPTLLVVQLGCDDPFFAGWLLITINLSDLAAAGAEPLGLVVNYTLPADMRVDDFSRLLEGVDSCARRHGTHVVGGDIRDGTATQLSATALGRCLPDHRLSRRGARQGDHLLLIGSPGYLWAAALIHAGRAQVPQPQAAEILNRACRPTAQLKAGRLLASAGLATAAIDVSDGLYASVLSLCIANSLGARMKSHIDIDPVLEEVCKQADVSTFGLGQTWGDWSLLVAVRPADLDQAVKVLMAADVGVRDVGSLTAGSSLVVDDGVTTSEWRGHDPERFSSRSWQGGIDFSWLK